ncbi:MAG: LysM domain-containing protein [Desulfobacteraceae bacterium]|nr:MAG: LysM domain-containing protein [Desulfobacteraceae bacterium]
MDDNLDNETKDLEEQIADNMRYNLEDENIPRHRAFLDFKSQRKILILGGVGIFLLIVLIAIFSRGGDKLSKKDLTSFKVRLDLLEKRLTRFEGVELRVASLEKKEKKLEQSVAEVGRSKILLAQRYNKLIQRLDRLQKGTTLAPAKTKGSIATQRKPPPLRKKRYHEVRSGETLYRIAQKYRISVDELCRLNNITKNQVIQPGQKLLIAPESN